MQRTGSRILGAIEAGGTKFVCGIGTGPDDLQTIRIPTTDPQTTITAAIDWLRLFGPPDAIGVGSFGPLDLADGRITSTPKPGWRDFDFAGMLRAAFNIPLVFETDVDAALIGEARWGAARGVANCIYVTVGTGIGGGALVDGRVIHGSTHPEMGHIRIPHDRGRDPFPGCCAFHGDCLEGLASGPAIKARWGCSGAELPRDHPAWELEAEYLATGLANLTCVLSPQRIVLGGGVMNQPQLLKMICGRLSCLAGNYLEMPEIRPPELGGNAGVLGAIALADELLA